MPQIIISDLLNKQGYFVIIANNGEEGVTKAQDESPDLILMDLNMPVMNGDDACISIKANPHTKNIPVLMLTSSQDKEDVMRSIKAGAEDYIIKSGDRRPLLKKVSTILVKKGVIRE